MTVVPYKNLAQEGLVFLYQKDRHAYCTTMYEKRLFFYKNKMKSIQ